MLRKTFAVACSSALIVGLSIAPVYSQAASLSAACSVSSASCISAVRAALGPNPTAARIAEVVASLQGLDLQDAQVAVNVAAAVADASTLSPDPQQQIALTNISAAIAAGGETATAAVPDPASPT
jgi:ribosomal protein L12E/L44/L45/RPP1/RPP2